MYNRKMVELGRSNEEIDEGREGAFKYLMLAATYDETHDVLSQLQIDEFDTFCLLAEIAKKLCMADIVEGLQKLGRYPNPKRSTLSRLGRLNPIARLEHTLLTQDAAMGVLDDVLLGFVSGDTAPSDAQDRLDLIQTSVNELFGLYEEVRPNTYQITSSKFEFWQNVWHQRLQRPDFTTDSPSSPELL